MGVVARKTFSHTPDEAMSDGLAKACGLGKMYSVAENISYFIGIFLFVSDVKCLEFSVNLSTILYDTLPDLRIFLPFSGF